MSDFPRKTQLSLDALLGPADVSVEEADVEEEAVEEVSAEPAAVSAVAESSEGSDMSRAKFATLAPMMRHYIELKKQYPEHALLYQVGDFYEVFYEDAKRVSAALGIRLTARNRDQEFPIPMCGVPQHAIDNYLPRLVEKGFSCVLVSQVEDDGKSERGMVKREISRIITPGIRYQEDGLDEKSYNYLLSCCIGPRGTGALAYVDVSVGNLRLQEIESTEELLEVVERLSPAEVVLPSTLFDVAVDSGTEWLRLLRRSLRGMGVHLVQRPMRQLARDVLKKQFSQFFQTDSKKDKGGEFSDVDSLGPESLSALDAVFAYVEEVSFGRQARFSSFQLVQSKSAVFIDIATGRNLELFATRIDGDRRNSLVGRIDYTSTPMGSRLLGDWISSPSLDLAEISARHDAVDEVKGQPVALDEVRALLAGVRDLDRLATRIGSLRASPRDLKSLAESLEVLPKIEQSLKSFSTAVLNGIAEHFDVLSDVVTRLNDALAEDPPTKINEGGIFRSGFSAEIDKQQEIRTKGRSWLSELEAREKVATGISALKVKYNNVFGYFIEITKAHLAKVPEKYERKQTLVNAERFVTPELKEYEQSILSAKSRQIEIEKEEFVQLRKWVAEQVSRLQTTSQQLSVVDVLFGFAQLAVEHNYSRPEMRDDTELLVQRGRHPVVEQVIGAHNFVPNDTLLNTDQRRFAVLTGPNMGGKSTYLRQVGLIQLLAQAGSFVPAEKAKLGLVDRIFTRIGAADDLTRGDSTFMVEMREAAVIVRKASSRSLVLIDEIGRGTATADGLSIAQAIAEWLLDTVGCRTIFATHFHELTELAGNNPGAFCLAVGVIERDKNIIFTHRIEEKVADRSYGIEVARLAGLPEPLLRRAESLLEAHETVVTAVKTPLTVEKTSSQDYRLRELTRMVFDEVRKFNPETMTPMQALTELHKLKGLVEE